MRSWLVVVVASVTLAKVAISEPKRRPPGASARDEVQLDVTLVQRGAGRCGTGTHERKLIVHALGRGNLQYISAGGNGDGDQLAFVSDSANIGYAIDDRGGTTEQSGSATVVNTKPSVAMVDLGAIVARNGRFVPLSDEGVAGSASFVGLPMTVTEYDCKGIVRTHGGPYADSVGAFYDGKEDPKGWRGKGGKLVLDQKAIRDALQGEKSAAFAANAHYTWKEGDDAWDATVGLVVRVRPPKVEAHLVPAAGYEKWMPQGPTPAKKDGGNSIAMHVVLVDPATGKPPDQVKVVKVVYALESSALPGACGNWPLPRDRDPDYGKPDLFFAAKPDSDQLELVGADWKKDVVVRSRDWGAYGKVQAHVELEGIGSVAATYAGAPALDLPLDTDHNHMADAWAPGRGLKEDADDETGGGIAQKGDGVTAFDEYRGLIAEHGTRSIPNAGEQHVLDEEHVQLAPTQREFFVVSQTDAQHRYETAIARGVAELAKLLSLHPIYIATRERLGDTADVPQLPRRALANAKDSKVAAVWITTTPPSTEDNGSIATAVPIQDCYAHVATCYHDPASLQWVRVFPDHTDGEMIALLGTLDADLSTWPGKTAIASATRYREIWAKQGIDEAARRTLAATWRKAAPDRKADLVVAAITHELGHAFGMLHHDELAVPHPEGFYAARGDQHCPMYYWQVFDPVDQNAQYWLTYFQGKWNPATDSPVGPKAFCKENLAQTHVHPE